MGRACKTLESIRCPCCGTDIQAPEGYVLRIYNIDYYHEQNNKAYRKRRDQINQGIREG